MIERREDLNEGMGTVFPNKKGRKYDAVYDHGYDLGINTLNYSWIYNFSVFRSPGTYKTVCGPLLVLS